MSDADVTTTASAAVILLLVPAVIGVPSRSGERRRVAPG
jgi:hypothetical protein